MTHAALQTTTGWHYGLSGLALLAGSLTLLPAQAQSTPPTQPHDAQANALAQPPQKDIVWLEKSRAYTRAGATALARTVDGWFGDAPFEASGGRVSGYLRVGGLWKQHDGTDINVRFRLRARLPNAQNKAYVFVGR